MTPAALLSIPLDEFTGLTEDLRMVALEYARTIGAGFGRISITLGMTMCDSPEYKHLVLDTLDEHELIASDRSMSTDLLEMRNDPRVKEFIRAWNREVALSDNPF